MSNIDNTVDLFKAIKKVEDKHEKDGVYFWTTKKLLQSPIGLTKLLGSPKLNSIFFVFIFYFF